MLHVSHHRIILCYSLFSIKYTVFPRASKQRVTEKTRSSLIALRLSQRV